MNQRIEKSLKRRLVIVRKQRLALCIIGCIAILCGVCFIHTNTDTVKAKNDNHKYFTHILIEEGDTVWNIAEEYITAEYDSTAEYVYEVERVNHISADDITEGCYLMIPYYAKQPITN